LTGFVEPDWCRYCAIAYFSVNVLAREHGYPSRSAFLEAIAMGQVELVVRPPAIADKSTEEITAPIVSEK
jgi:hypothetical protein